MKAVRTDAPPPVTLDEAIEFIIAKTELLAKHALLPEERMQMSKALESYDRMWGDPRLSLRQLRSLDDGLLERYLNNSTMPNVEAEIRRALLTRFKTSRLRRSDQAIAKRVLKRGRIADLEEYYRVKEFVSCTSNGGAVGEADRAILSSLLGSYDRPDAQMPDPEPLPAGGVKPAGRRRPLPPFDYLLAADEKLCAIDTSLEKRQGFVQAKFERVMERTAFPEDRQTLLYQLNWGVSFALSAQTPDYRRARQFEWSEHEAEFFAGYGVSGAQHREIETELEQRFGFRRLGLSAQGRLARMLSTDDALDRDNRLIVERFIHAYPHQTLFTRAQIKRAKELLKLPSPSQTPLPVLKPRPKGPTDMSLLCIGAVFAIARDPRPHRVIAFDEIEVFYDVESGKASGAAEESWTFGMYRGRTIYYRDCTPLFLDGAKRLRIDEPSPEYVALHRPDLPLRFGRSETLQWQHTPCGSQEEFLAHVEKIDPLLLQQPPLNACSLVLIPRSPKGAMQKPVLVTARSGGVLSIAELLWEAHRWQRPSQREPKGGVGFYRSGCEKKGVPSFFIGGFMDPGGSLKWHHEAPAP